MDAIREVIAAMYLAAAYAGGPGWLTRSNELLERIANDQETGTEAARLLRVEPLYLIPAVRVGIIGRPSKINQPSIVRAVYLVGLFGQDALPAKAH
jgi:hypothetical protein